jgi:hypothetical protein
MLFFQLSDGQLKMKDYWTDGLIKVALQKKLYLGNLEAKRQGP